jgi:TetR/AcrR family transcriptional repressor of nem operon
MKEVGLTHGTFYTHFASKEDLIAAALIHAADSFRSDLQTIAGTDRHGRRQVGRLADAYLRLGHARDPGSGCPIAALGSELPRLGEPIASAFAEGVERSIRMIQDALDEAEGPDPLHHERAVASLATAVGGMILARAARDEAGAQAVLDACRSALIGRAAAAQGEH